MRRAWKLAIGVAAGVVAVPVLFVALLASPCWYANLTREQLPFDSARWTVAAAHPHEIRRQMVDDLVERRGLVGMSVAKADALLGVERPTGYFRDWDRVYPLGHDACCGVDMRWLVLRVRGDVVVEQKLVCD